MSVPGRSLYYVSSIAPLSYLEHFLTSPLKQIISIKNQDRFFLECRIISDISEAPTLKEQTRPCHWQGMLCF